VGSGATCSGTLALSRRARCTVSGLGKGVRRHLARLAEGTVLDHLPIQCAHLQSVLTPVCRDAPSRNRTFPETGRMTGAG
jgi:hypothetical protein